MITFTQKELKTIETTISKRELKRNMCLGYSLTKASEASMLEGPYSYNMKVDIQRFTINELLRNWLNTVKIGAVA